MLLVGAFYGRAGGLILVGLLATVATVIATVVEDASAGELRDTPRSAAAVDEQYQLGVGEIRVDLREVSDLSELDGRTVDVDLQVGRIEVIVPEDGLTVVADADIDVAGHARVFDEEQDGSVRDELSAGPRAPVLTIDADIDFGEIVIHEEAAR
jgi:hypothetical protein